MTGRVRSMSGGPRAVYPPPGEPPRPRPLGKPVTLRARAPVPLFERAGPPGAPRGPGDATGHAPPGGPPRHRPRICPGQGHFFRRTCLPAGSSRQSLPAATLRYPLRCLFDTPRFAGFRLRCVIPVPGGYAAFVTSHEPVSNSVRLAVMAYRGDPRSSRQWRKLRAYWSAAIATSRVTARGARSSITSDEKWDLGHGVPLARGRRER